MNDQDKAQFGTMLLKALELYDKAPKPAILEAWYRALKEFPLQKVQTALDQHVKFGRYAPRPGDIVRRINGTDDKGETKENTAGAVSKDRRCCYEDNGARCPGITSYFTFGDRGYCREHEQHKHEPAHMQRILENYQLNGPPFVPRSPHRQRAEFLYASGGADLVLSGLRDPSGDTWGPYDHRVVAWLDAQVPLGGVRPFSFETSTPRPRSVAEATGYRSKPEALDLNL